MSSGHGEARGHDHRRQPRTRGSALCRCAAQERGGLVSPRVLIVDDNHDLADNLAELLEQEGYAVATAYSGEKALVLAETDVFDTVLTDVRMPGISGVDLVKRLRGLNPETSFLLMTAYSS
ncbi:MAG TPA: response regulator, partial [Nannocystis exedens]|nr:response regulator [Nannocystis exedens]